jgi:hypothetical protein
VEARLFFLHLSIFKKRLLRGASDAEQAHIYRILSSMHWSVQLSYVSGLLVAVRWHSCGFERSSLCLLPDEPTTRFAYARPEDHRDAMPADERFLRACGVRPPEVLGNCSTKANLKT